MYLSLFEAAKADLQNAKAVARHGAWVVFDDTCFSPLRAVWSEALETQLVEPPSESITFCPTTRHGIARLAGGGISRNTHKPCTFLYYIVIIDICIYIYIYILYIYIYHIYIYIYISVCVCCADGIQFQVMECYTHIILVAKLKCAADPPPK